MYCSKVAGEIWITYKQKGAHQYILFCVNSFIFVIVFLWLTHYIFRLSDQESKHGKVIRVSSSRDAANPTLTATEGFTVNLLTYNAIQVGCEDSKHSCIFLAPRSVYSGVHKKSVIIFDNLDWIWNIWCYDM